MYFEIMNICVVTRVAKGRVRLALWVRVEKKVDPKVDKIGSTFLGRKIKVDL